MNYDDLDVNEIVAEIDQAYKEGRTRPAPKGKKMEIQAAARRAIETEINDDSIAARLRAKKKITVSMRLPVGIVTEVKTRAAIEGVSWTAYVGEILEQAIAEPRLKA
jgi:predicted DNA binding CopG/RHH family protein